MPGSSSSPATTSARRRPSRTARSSKLASSKSSDDVHGGCRTAPVVPSALASGAHPAPAYRDQPTPSIREVPLGQDAPHLVGRPHTVGSQARPAGDPPPRGAGPASKRREDLRRESPEHRRHGRTRGDDHRPPRSTLGAGPGREG